VSGPVGAENAIRPRLPGRSATGGGRRQDGAHGARIPHRPVYAVPWLAEHLARLGVDRSCECPVAAGAYPRLVEVETGPHLPREAALVSADGVAKVWRHVDRLSLV